MAAGQAPVQPGRVMQIQRADLQFITVGQFTPVNPDVSLPLDSTRNGNIFGDRFNPQISWYLPTYQLAPDIDASFAFAAAAEGIDSDGNPYYQATITLTLDKAVPPDVATYAAANPTMQLQEIPLTGLAVNLTTTANDPQTGQVQQSIYPATTTADTNGNLTLTFSTLLGTQVLIAYNNLRIGGATVSLSATFEVWRTGWVFHPIFRPPIEVGQIPVLQGQPRPLPMLAFEPVRFPIPTPVRFPTKNPPAPPTPPEPTYMTASDPFTVTLPLGQKYAAPGYARSYTITDSNGVRPIISINDLQNFNTTQSEFSEYTALGNVSDQFPSFSRLYIGALSRTIVAVPSAYGIVRSKDGTAAQCQALLDSSAGGSGAAKFQFAFVLGPVVSPFDLFALQEALASNPQSQGFTLGLPERLDFSQPATLATPFQSSVTYTVGLQPQTFELAVEISDGNLTGSAVANANLFLKQLSATVEPYLSGSFGITLDDAYPHPVIASVVVNLSDTSGSDEISYSVAPDSNAIELVNNSPLDLEVTRYAVITGTNAPPESLGQKIPSQQTLTLSDKASSPAVSLLVDRTLALEDPFTKDALQRYVAFATQDVQSVNYQLGVVANGVDFDVMGIAQIDVAITIPDLPNVSVPNSSLSALSLSTNAQIALPIQYAISSLPGVIAFTAKSKVATQADVKFTAKNDFIDQPVYVLQASSIPPFLTVAS